MLGGGSEVWKVSQSSLALVTGVFSRLPLILSGEGAVKGAGSG